MSTVLTLDCSYTMSIRHRACATASLIVRIPQLFFPLLQPKRWNTFRKPEKPKVPKSTPPKPQGSKMDQMGWRTVGVILDASGRPRKRYQPRAVNFILASGTKTDSFPNLPHGTPMGYLRGSGEDLMGSGGYGGRLTDNGNVTPCPSRRSGPAACLPAALNQWGGPGGWPRGRGGPRPRGAKRGAAPLFIS